MDELVFKLNDGRLVTSSLLVAKKFEKEHKNVLQSIRTIINSAERSAQFYESTTYIDKSGKSNDAYVMNRDGFSLLVMGFIGEKAMNFKLDFIAAFNQMESHIKQQVPVTYIEALEALVASEKQKAIQQTIINELQPKADVFDVISNADNLLSMNDAAKTLKIGRNTLMSELRKAHIFQSNNTPYQRYIDSGYFKVFVNPIKMGDKTCNVSVTKVTGEGLTWLGSKRYFI